MYKILQVAIITILCDQLSKLTMLYLLDLPSVGIIDVFPPYLQFTMAWNYGVNFGSVSYTHLTLPTKRIV